MKKPTTPKEFIVDWYCRKCWQEGTITFQGDVPPEGYPDPGKIAAVVKQHAVILKGFIRSGKCSGDIHPQQERKVRKRVRRIKPPPLPDPDGAIIVSKKGTL